MAFVNNTFIKNKRAGVNLDIVVLVILTLLICITTLYMAYQTDSKRGVTFSGVENLYELEMNRNDANFYLQMACDESLIKTYREFLNNKTALISDDKIWFVEKYRSNLKLILGESPLLLKYLDFLKIEFDGQIITVVIASWESELRENTALNATFVGDLFCRANLKNFGLNSTSEMNKIYSDCFSLENKKLECFNSRVDSFIGSSDENIFSVSNPLSSPNFYFVSKKQFFYDSDLRFIDFVWN